MTAQNVNMEFNFPEDLPKRNLGGRKRGTLNSLYWDWLHYAEVDSIISFYHDELNWHTARRSTNYYGETVDPTKGFTIKQIKQGKKLVSYKIWRWK